MEFAGLTMLVFAMMAMTKAVPLWNTAAVECNMQTDSSRRNTEFRIEPQCQKGRIEWTYTVRNMHLYFEKPGPYRVCFYSKYKRVNRKYTLGVVENGAQYELGAPSIGNDVCIESSGGPLHIVVRPNSIFYKTWVSYEVTCLSQQPVWGLE